MTVMSTSLAPPEQINMRILQDAQSTYSRHKNVSLSQLNKNIAMLTEVSHCMVKVLVKRQ